MRGNSTYYWTLWEKQLLFVGLANGLSFRVLAKGLNRSRNAVAGEVYRVRNSPEKRVGFPNYGRAFPIQVYSALDDEMAERLDKFRGSRSRASALRDIIEWGLEAAEDL